MSSRIFLLFFILSSFSFPFVLQAKGNNSSSPQVLKFDGLDINSSKGTPRDAFVSAKKKAQFDYFFNTKISVKKKMYESFEGVR